jgi:hypothetical protein
MLGVCVIHHHTRIGIEAVLLDDAHYACDGEPGRLIASTDALSHRVALRPEPVSHLLVYENDLR